MRRQALLAPFVALAACASAVAGGIDRPWIADTYFYWYAWDYQKEFGSWVGGVYNTPLYGYYDSASYRDNLRSLRTASEWGITDHFMDYWGPGWKGEGGEPREATVMRAAEELQRRGYDIHMSFYQDGEDFDMADFERNLDAGRHFRFYVENWGDSPALPRVEREPVYLIYSRNGRPAPTQDNEGFREWLKERYRTLEALNEAWRTSHGSWDDVVLDYGGGRPRADSIRYGTHVWQTQWERTKDRAREELRLPAPRVSFDVAYQPYLGWGYSPLAEALGGPHSYGGIFGEPDDQDTERFIQAAVAKCYGTVFLDHFKNFYHDVEIRTPGTIYPPDFCAFDRFWAGALVRRSEALLHLSWNEWWEGSNLEPCWEFGKTYCEKNLLWATIMKQCFDSLHNWNRGAKVAVLLNDWLWLVGGRHTEDVYGCIQALRRSNVTFDLLPDDFVTLDRLADIETVIAPTGAVGLGYNADERPIAEVLKDWVSQERQPGKGPVRRLIVGQMPEYLDWLGIEFAEGKRGEQPGPDMNVFVDVGVEGDERFITAGCSGRENWGQLPEGSFGATDRDLTCRWTPAVGLTTTMVFPLSPNRDHVLRLQGSGFRPNRATVMVGNRKAASFDIESGMNEYEVRIPARVVGQQRVAEIRLVYDRANVPKEIDPERFDYESRVCNLAIDWVQLSTDNVPAHTTEQQHCFPEERVRFTSKAPRGLRGNSYETDWVPHDTLAASKGQVKSRYASDRAPRDIVVGKGPNEVWYCNGLVGAAEGRIAEELVTEWAGHAPAWELQGEDVLGALLDTGGNTQVAVVYNYDTTRKKKVRLRVPMTARSLVEVMALSQDGVPLRRLTNEATVEDGSVLIDDNLTYYAAYAISCGPVEPEIPELVMTAGSRLDFNVALDNNEPRPTTVELSLVSPVPTITATTVGAELADYEDATVPFEITCSPDADWGEKTVIFDLSTSGRHVYLWRKLTILPQPELSIGPTVIDRAHPKIAVESPEHPLTPSGTAARVSVTIAGNQTRLGDLPSGRTAIGDIEVPPPTDTPCLITRLAELSWSSGTERREKVQPIHFACYPRQFAPVPAAASPLLIFNESVKPLSGRPLTLPTAQFRRYVKGDFSRLYVRDDSGKAVPSQVSADRSELLFLADVKARAGRTYFVCVGEAPPVPTELAVTPEALGSGHGRVTIGNQALELALDEQAGGTAVSLRSLTTNTDYGAQSFGAARGTWGTFDPLSPATHTADLLEGISRHSQAETPAKLRLLESGPVRAVVAAEFEDESLKAGQTYAVWSKAPWVRVSSSVRPLRKLGKQEEVTVVDGRLKRGALTKIFPNFVGIQKSFEEDKLQHGWRQTTYVPDYFTAMTPNDFPESVSLVLLDHEGVDSIRQGFWPAKRGETGPCELAWIELLSHRDAGASATVDVLIHKGHQPVAREHLEAVRTPPLVIVPEKFSFEAE
jgi:hypothetical protein